MTTEIDIPRRIPLMTLYDIVLFPHAVLPLYIFEPRYRQMITESLAESRVIAISAFDEKTAIKTDSFEPCFATATVGMIRMAFNNPDGSVNVIIQGLARVKCTKIVREDPYRIVEIEPLSTEDGTDTKTLAKLQQGLTRLVRTKQYLGGVIPPGMLEFLKEAQDPETALDMAAFTLCTNTSYKQRLLETLNIAERYDLYLEHLRGENDRLRLERKIRGSTREDDIGLN